MEGKKNKTHVQRR